jgi:hypothetical protein
MSPLIGAKAFSDIEGGLKTWLRGLNLPNVGTRVFLGMPRGGPSSYPVIVLFRVSGGPATGADYPMDEPRVQFDVWGNTGGKVECQAVAQALISNLLDLPCGTLLGTTVRAVGVSALTVNYLPDAESGRPRYSIDCVVQAQAV